MTASWAENEGRNSGSYQIMHDLEDKLYSKSLDWQNKLALWKIPQALSEKMDWIWGYSDQLAGDFSNWGENEESLSKSIKENF